MHTVMTLVNNRANQVLQGIKLMPFKLANVEGRAALVAGDDYFDLETLSGGSLGSDPMAALNATDQLAELTANLAGATPTGSLASAHLGAPVPRPPNVFGVGLNYRNHAVESGMAIPVAPMVFAKFSSCICGPTDDVVMRSDYIDFEGELVVVIGRAGKDIKAEDAWSHVAGLSVGQDISDRPLQFIATPPQFNLGKSFDTFGPMGPVLVSPDSLEDPSSLKLETVVNGETRQSDNTNDLIFDVPTLISWLSQITTLQVGDAIYSGTPGGVGVVEGRFLKDGDVVRTTIEGLGTMENRCVRGPDHANADFVPPMIEKMVAAQKAKASGG